ncbi:MAG: lipocalin family protein [Thermodesulfobacteriota bacterium]
MHMHRIILVCVGAVVLSVLLSPIYAQHGPRVVNATTGDSLVGRWEIFKTKAPGRPYLPKYKGRPFVSVGPNSYTVIYEYHSDGTFQRITKIDGKNTVENGRWEYTGNELRLKIEKGRVDEVLYLRFDGPDQFTAVEVYEETSDPGIFAQFKRIK